MSAEWAKAYVAAQAEMPEILKDKTANAGKFSYSYADLATILNKVRPHLAKHGLGVSQDVETTDHGIAVKTTIYHSSGEAVEFGPIVFPGGNDAQQAGSSITYARRYSLSAALNIAAEEDDDGNRAKNSAGSAATPSPSQQRPKAEPKPSGSPPKHSRGGETPQAAHPSQPQASRKDASPSRDQSQESGGDGQQGTGGEAGSVPPATESSWVSLVETFGATAVLQVAQERAKDVGEKQPFTKKALLDLSQATFDHVAKVLAEQERVSA